MDQEARKLAGGIGRGNPTEALRAPSAPLGKTSIEELRAIAERSAAHIKRPYLDHAELLYDEHGLPK